jgi:hypothetical protein
MMFRPSVALCLLFAGCASEAGRTTPVPTDAPPSDGVVDASATSDAPTPPRDPVGRWSCDLLAWNEAAMRYDGSDRVERIPVTILRTAQGLSWRIDALGPGSGSATIPLVAGEAGWHLEGPLENPGGAGLPLGRTDRFDVSWRGDRLLAETRGTLSGSVVMTVRFLFDCARAVIAP